MPKMASSQMMKCLVMVNAAIQPRYGIYFDIILLCKIYTSLPIRFDLEMFVMLML